MRGHLLLGQGGHEQPCYASSLRKNLKVDDTSSGSKGMCSSRSYLIVGRILRIFERRVEVAQYCSLRRYRGNNGIRLLVRAHQFLEELSLQSWAFSSFYRLRPGLLQGGSHAVRFRCSRDLDHGDVLHSTLDPKHVFWHMTHALSHKFTT